MHFPEDMLLLEKWDPKKPLSAIYFDATKNKYFGKRFLIESPDREEAFVKEGSKIELSWFSADWRPVCVLHFFKPRNADVKPPQEVRFEDFIAPKGIKAMGNQLATEKLKKIASKEPLPYTPEPEVPTNEIEAEVEEISPEKDDTEGQISLEL